MSGDVPCLFILTREVLSLLGVGGCQGAPWREEEGRGRKLTFSVIFLCQFRNPTACGGRGLSQSWALSSGSCIRPEAVSAISVGRNALPLSFPGTFSPLGLATYMVLHESCPAKGRMRVGVAAGSSLCGPGSLVQITPPFHRPNANANTSGPHAGPCTVPLSVYWAGFLFSAKM